MSAGPEDTSTVTLKAGTGFDSPWLVVYGNPSAQRRQLLEAFAIEDDPELSLVELSAKLAVDFQAIYALAKGGGTQQTGGRKVSSTRSKSSTATADSATSAEAAPEEPAAVESEGEQHPALAKIAAATTPLELKAVWAKYMDDFKDNTELQSAYRDKRNELN